jgi:hypothetical protein
MLELWCQNQASGFSFLKQIGILKRVYFLLCHRRWKPVEDLVLSKLPDEIVAQPTGHQVGSDSVRSRLFKLNNPSR